MRRLFTVVLVLVAALFALQPPPARAHVGDPEFVTNAWIAVPVNLGARLQLVPDTVTIHIDPAPAGTAGVWTGKIARVSATVAPSEQLRFAPAQVAVRQSAGRLATRQGAVAEPKGWISTGTFPKNVMQ